MLILSRSLVWLFILMLSKPRQLFYKAGQLFLWNKQVVFQLVDHFFLQNKLVLEMFNTHSCFFTDIDGDDAF